MAAYKSVQETKRTGAPAKMLDTNERHGRIRHAYFDYVVPAGGVAINDTIDLCMVPKGARLLGGKFANEALGTSTQVSIGDGTTATKYLDATSTAAAAATDFANTIALYLGEEQAADLVLQAKVTGAALTAGTKIRGYALYVLD